MLDAAFLCHLLCPFLPCFCRVSALPFSCVSFLPLSTRFTHSLSLAVILALTRARALSRSKSPRALLCLHHHADTNCQSHQTLKARISRTLYRFMHLAPCPPPPPARLPCSTAASCLTRPHLCPPLPKRPAPEPLEKQSLEKVSYPVSNAKCSLMPHALSCHMLPLSVCLPISCN